MANNLKFEKKVPVIHMLAEGSSIRSIERITGVKLNTIMKLGLRVGAACAKIMDSKMRGLACKQIEVDEIWGFICKVHSTMLCTPAVALKLATETWTIEKLIEEAVKDAI